MKRNTKRDFQLRLASGSDDDAIPEQLYAILDRIYECTLSHFKYTILQVYSKD